MTPVTEASSTPSGVRKWCGVLLRSLGSLKLAVVLIVVLIVVLAWATRLESREGREVAQWFVYSADWFVGLLALLATNITAAMLVRFPWRLKHVGFLIAHVGLLLLLLGGIQTFLNGIEGILYLTEGTKGNAIVLPKRSQFKLLARHDGDVQSTEFSFTPGPVDWPDGKQLDFGELDGCGLKILKFYRHAKPITSWIEDDSGTAQPAIQIAVVKKDGTLAESQWFVPSPFGPRPFPGQPAISIQQASMPSMLDDFLKAPEMAKDGKGVLTVHYKDQVYPIVVADNLKKDIPLGDTGTTVKILDYYANARSEGHGRFSSIGKEPLNPMLQLQVQSPDHEKPITEIAYAATPFMNYLSMRKQPCPVRFWYHFPGVTGPAGVEFLQLPDGKLYCRSVTGTTFESLGEVKAGGRVKLTAGQELELISHVRHGKQDITFTSAEMPPGAKEGPEAAALVKLTAGGKSEEYWLGRDYPQYGLRRMDTDKGPYIIMFGYERLPLGFDFALIDFQRGLNPGQMGNASFSSQVRITDAVNGTDFQETISMNRPLRYKQFDVYQSSFRNLSEGREMSVFNVAHDPGRFLKYLGSIMVCVGIFGMFYVQRTISWSRANSNSTTTAVAESEAVAPFDAVADAASDVASEAADPPADNAKDDVD